MIRKARLLDATTMYLSERCFDKVADLAAPGRARRSCFEQKAHHTQRAVESLALSFGEGDEFWNRPYRRSSYWGEGSVPQSRVMSTRVAHDR
jgi:hypothetical protein